MSALAAFQAITLIGAMMNWDRRSSRRLANAAALAFRLTAASLLALWLAQILNVALPLWSALTALIVTQISLGRSLKVTLRIWIVAWTSGHIASDAGHRRLGGMPKRRRLWPNLSPSRGEVTF